MSAIEPLLAALEHPAKRQRRQAAEALGELGASDPALRTRLLGELDTGTLDRRWTVAYALFLAGERSARLWPVLLEALGSADGDLRWAASRLVVALDVPDLTGRLLDALAAGPAAQRKMALYCLREHGVQTPRIQAAVIAALDDGDPGIRLAAMSSLVVIATDAAAAAEALRRRLDDVDPGVRRAAAAALGRLGVGTPEVLAQLARAADADDEALARAARGALERLRNGRPE
ncbi:MAG TPA: HEAT repeat domain-containing protein [Candidatus Limnocylindria bacterium]|nr:HEAT repeat domain-containing protein [Candidatus Limnocylindria bacterium]